MSASGGRRRRAGGQPPSGLGPAGRARGGAGAEGAGPARDPASRCLCLSWSRSSGKGAVYFFSRGFGTRFLSNFVKKRQFKWSLRGVDLLWEPSGAFLNRLWTDIHQSGREAGILSPHQFVIDLRSNSDFIWGKEISKSLWF